MKKLKNKHSKNKAHSLVQRAKKKGVLITCPCEVCGTEKNVVAHHTDYSQPLKVMWLCRKHHTKWHQENGVFENIEEDEQRKIISIRFSPENELKLKKLITKSKLNRNQIINLALKEYEERKN